MCGIAGFVEFGERRTPGAERIGLREAMSAMLVHRGPDESTALDWEGVCIGFRRLSINGIDAGSQPFHSADGAISVLVNGELYNHAELRRAVPDSARLDTGSDCEVLPDLYARFGSAAFQRINGMFGAVVLDRRERQLLLVRDRLGIKPLFYVRRPGTGRLIVASELKALFAHPETPRTFDWRAALMSHNWPKPGEEALPSFFEGVERVPAGSILRLDLESGAVAVEKYWNLDEAAAALEPPMRSEAPHRFRELLADSVRYRASAEAGVGLFLSGGIDSVAIAALALPSRPIPTYSVWNRATVGSGDAAASRAAAEALGLPNDALRIDADDAPDPDDWRNLLWACELFSITAEQWYKFRLHAHARAADSRLKVILLGQGADEFLGGYAQRLAGIRRRMDQSDWHEIDRALAAGQKRRAVALADVNPMYRQWFDEGTLDGAALDQGPGETWQRYRARYRPNLDYHLWHEDRTASAHGIENRVPFLDHRLLEFMASIPDSQRARWFTDKRLLRDAVADAIPTALAQRPKAFFFRGPGEQDAYRLIADLLRADGGVLLDQALAGSRATGGPLSERGLRDLAGPTLDDPALRHIMPLMSLVNMGVLADLACNAGPDSRVRPGVPPAILDDEGRRTLLAATFDPALDTVLAMASSFSILEVLRPAHGESPSGTILLAEGDSLREEIDHPELVRFLLQVDGRSTLRRIAERIDVAPETLMPAIRDAIDLGLLVEAPPGRGDAVQAP